MDCIFCKIAERQIKAYVILETERSIAFLDAFPLSRGHTLVIPKKHYEKIQDMSKDDSADLFDTVHKIISKVDALTGSTLLASHNGKNAGQEIPHVHMHLVPRSPDDSAGPVHGMFTKRPSLLESDFEQIRKQLTQ